MEEEKVVLHADADAMMLMLSWTNDPNSISIEEQQRAGVAAGKSVHTPHPALYNLDELKTNKIGP